MRALLLLLLLALPPFAYATLEVRGELVRVLFDDPALESYARRVAATADAALLEVAALFAVEPPPVVLVIDQRSDVFNAVAPPLPRPTVSLRPLFPLRGETGFGARDPLRLLLLHELTHDVQLGYAALPAGAAPLERIGLVGEQLARPSPLWFIEGIATWVESTLNEGGGRLQDARTRGLLDSLALEGDWPTLTEAGLASYAAWPGRQTRYLVGSGFVDHLVAAHGFEAFLATLRAFNGGGLLGDFAGAWRRAAASDLADEWEAYRLAVVARAEARAAERVEVESLTTTAGLTGTPVPSPTGERLAWTTWPPAIALAELSEAGLAELRVVRADTFPGGLDWLDEDTLVYTRIDRQPGSELAELFALDLDSGRERRLTTGARAAFVRAGPDGCLWYVRDVASEGSSLQRWCDGAGEAGRGERVWQAPGGQHIVGLDVSPGGRVALSLWRGGRVDLLLLDDGVPTLLTDGPDHDIDPVWDDERTLLFASDRTGIFELHALTLEGDVPSGLRRVTASLGGAFAPAGGGSGVFVALGAGGYDLARVAADAAVADAVALAAPPLTPAPFTSAPFTPALPPTGSAAVPYSPLPSLAPYGWLPSDAALEIAPFRAALAIDIVGQDDGGDHSYALTLGYDSALAGPLAGAHLALRYGYRDPEALLPAFAAPAALSAGFRLGVWPHRPHLGPRSETALGAEVEVGARFDSDPLLLGRLRVGLLHLVSLDVFAPELRADLIVSRQFADPFGYRTRGGRVVLTALSSPGPGGRSSGVWADGSLFLPRPLGLPGTGEARLRLGWRQAPPVPLVLGDLATVATLGYRQSFALGWRYGDGRYALERLSAEGRLRAWYDGEIGVGGDVGLWADTMLWYAAPLSLGGTVGYAQGWWVGAGVRLGF